MNKKFFAALASATMAFTASGSIAVFADDFVEEKTPVLDGNDVKPLPEKVLWNKENFGDLAVKDTVNTNVSFTKPFKVTDGYVKTEDLANVTSITFKDNADDNKEFKGEIKGLEYFTGLTTFDDTHATISNKTLDFSANTKLTTLSVKHAADLTKIVLPEAYLDEDEVEQYSLATLKLQNTKLTSLDFSKQEKLDDVTVDYNYNLKEVLVAKGTKANPHPYKTLNISACALEEIDLENVKVTETFALDDNRLGILDLSKTTIAISDNDAKTNVVLDDQKLYVSESLATINVKDTFDNVDTHDFTAKGYNVKTGVMKLDENDGKYTYAAYDKDNKKRELKVTVEKANPMNRLYNPNSGEHFYTADIKEKEALVALGWNDEGYGWVAPSTSTASTNTKKGDPVYRLYNPNAGDHHYTTDKDEKDTLVAYGWKDEEIGWYSASTTADKVAVYRQYNPNSNGAGSHNYTTDKAENDYLVSVGWVAEGKGWDALR